MANEEIDKTRITEEDRQALRELNREMATIDITPRGMTTDEGVQRINAALNASNEAAVALANAATDFFCDHHVTLLEVARGEAVSLVNREALRDALRRIDAFIRTRSEKHGALFSAVAGHPEPVAFHELTELIHAEPGNGPWALYIFGPDGMHSGKQWFDITVEYPEEQITVAEAKAKAEAAIAQGLEVRVCDGADFLVFHSVSGKTVHAVHGEGFWEAITN